MYLLVCSLIFLFIPLSYEITGNPQCLKENACSCRFNDGTGIDLTEIKGASEYLSSQLPNSTTIYFHPCGDLPNLPKNGCNSSSLCLEHYVTNQTNEKYQNVGVAKDVIFNDEDEYHIQMIFKTVNLTTTITLKCTEKETTHTLTYVQWTGSFLNLDLYSPLSCRRDLETGGSSTGTILILFFLLFAFVYFVGGAVLLFFLRGARGREMIPNVEFWSNLPGLVRDGVIFIQNGCKAPSSSQNVYDQI